MGSNNEYEHQSSNDNNLPKGWTNYYVKEYDLNVAFNSEFFDRYFGGLEETKLMSCKGEMLTFKKL